MKLMLFKPLKLSDSNSTGFRGIRLKLLGLFLLPSLTLTLSLSGLATKSLAQKKFPSRQIDNPQPDNLQQDKKKSKEFTSLQQKLEDYGFQVKLEIPPYADRYGRKPYGLVRNQEKTVWINPIVFELGNELPVLIHETIHAAQICAGSGNLSPLNIDLEAPQIASPYFLRYHNLRRKLEAEAYIVQTQPNSLELAAELLDQHCAPEEQL